MCLLNYLLWSEQMLDVSIKQNWMISSFLPHVLLVTAFSSLCGGRCRHPASQPVQPPQCAAKRPESVWGIVLLLESQRSFVSVLSCSLYRIHTLCCIFSTSKFAPFVPAILEQSFRPLHLLHCIFRQRWKMADLMWKGLPLDQGWVCLRDGEGPWHKLCQGEGGLV